MRSIGVIILLITASLSWAHNAPKFIFQQNKNQWPQKVNFAADMGAGQVFIEKTGLTYVLYNGADLEKQHAKKFDKENFGSGDIVHAHVFKVEFVNAKLTDQTASKQQPEYYNYFLGNDPVRWASNVRAFEEIYYRNIYKNVDAKFYGAQGNFKYDFIVKPGGNVSGIKLNYQFTQGLSLVNNKLIIHTSVGQVIENIPEAYQIINGKKVKVECSYVLNKNEVSFALGTCDPNYEVVIDPVVIISSYSGTQSISYGLGVAPDKQGNIFLYSMNITRAYPVTSGAIQMNSGGGPYDSVLSKFNFLGTSKRFSTYIGGNKDDKIITCFIQNGEIAVLGSTRSDTFPIINSGFQTVSAGNIDYFVMKIDTSGTSLIGSTYLGGVRAESASIVNTNGFLYVNDNKGDLVMDQWNNCYVMGCTFSHNFPTTPGAHREYSDSNNLTDITITKFNRNLSSVIWSTYYGGSGSNYPVGVKVSRSGKLYCGGGTNSRNFPTTPGVAFTQSVSTHDMVGFILDTLAGFPIASSYLGARYTEAHGMAIDQNDNAYFLGHCIASPPTITPTPGAYNTNTGREVFYKMDPAFSQVLAVARFGYNNVNQNVIELDAFNVDSCGYVYFGGFGYAGLPVTSDAVKTTAATNGNIYMGVLSPGFSSLKYGSYYGGNSTPYQDHDDGGTNHFDERGRFYHAICVSDGYPLSPNAYSGYAVTATNNPQSDAFVKIDLQTFVNANLSLGGQTKSCSAITQTFFASPNFGTVTIDPGDGSGVVNTNSLVHSYTSHGTYTAWVIAGTDPTTCNHFDSVQVIIKYGPTPSSNLEDVTENCGGEPLILDAGNPGSKYIWDTGDTTQAIQPATNGKHWVMVDNGFCEIKDSTEVLVNPGHDLSMPNAFTPNGDGTNEQFCLQGWEFCNLEFKIMIFSRWGEKVFESDDPNFCWDGKYKGQLLSSDVYIYHITSKFKGDRTETRKGNITLIR